MLEHLSKFGKEFSAKETSPGRLKTCSVVRKN